MSLAAGGRLGAYEILGPLGAGGMGEVYRARDPRLGREVAIKLLPDALGSSPEHLARFEREARTVAALNHPNIVVLHSIEQDEGTRFITMELIEGRSLTAHVVRGGLGLDRLLGLAIPLTDALAAAHDRGVVHRDLKPANVMVTPEGRVKVLDFGIAKPMHAGAAVADTAVDTEALALTTAGAVVGTLPYMAPEQIRGEAVDARSDLFSLGIVLYELATGCRPFAGETMADLSAAILRDPPPALGGHRTEPAGELESIIARCLEKQPRDRFQSAREVVTALSEFQRTLERGAPQVQRRPERAASIAVLPFVNRTPGGEDEYFSDGLADELLGTLAKIRDLRVAARTSAFHFKGKDVTLGEVGRALQVATVLEGSVRKSGNRVRISVQLVKVADGFHLWSETYDRMLDDIFAVQDDIAHAVVKELRATLLGEPADAVPSDALHAEVARMTKGRTRHPEAHRLFLQGRHLVARRTRDDTARGIAYVQQALALDPEFALAWSDLGVAWSRETMVRWSSEGYQRAQGALERALALDPDLADAHAAMGMLRVDHAWDWRSAETSVGKALALEPGNAYVVRCAGILAVNQGRFEDAVALDRRAVELDPLSAAGYHNLGRALHADGQVVEAEAAFRKALELVPQRILSHAELALALLDQERTEEAVAEAAAEPHESVRCWVQAIVTAAINGPAASTALLAEMIAHHAQDSAAQIAEIFAVRGETDAAFEWLERAFNDREVGMLEIQTVPRLRSLHADPRWGALLHRMGFPTGAVAELRR